MLFVPVVDKNQNPLMPTTPMRAERWIKSGKATPFWKRGIFCVRLNQEPSRRNLQPIAVGIDPGIKKEGYTVKSESHTYLNIQADAVDWVKNAVKTRKIMRRSRRNRKTPHRKNKTNRRIGGLSPSTKARWQWKLRLAKWLKKLFPISCFVVEDIRARTKGKRRWDASFSPLEVGKRWFYSELRILARVELEYGWETKLLRDALGLKKSDKKLLNKFSAHCVDSWVMANAYIGGHIKPDNESIVLIKPLRFHRRQLHRFQPRKGGFRPHYGGTRSLGMKRGSLVSHPKYGFCYVGGTNLHRISLHDIKTGDRLSKEIKVSDCKFLSYNSWRFYIP